MARSGFPLVDSTIPARGELGAERLAQRRFGSGRERLTFCCGRE
jgi:hypothetical protein